MKIKLINATFYFNPPVNLTPLQREVEIDLATLSDLEVRKLFVGVSSGVIDIAEGKDAFLTRYETVRPKKKTEVTTPKEEAPVEVPVEQVNEQVTTDAEAVEPKEVEEKPKTTRTTKKTTTATKK